MKKTIFSLISFLTLAFVLVRPALAIEEKLEITLTALPSYETRGDFRVYYTYFDTLGKVATVNLNIEKDGKGYRLTQDKNKTAVSGYFQIEGADLYDGQGKYNLYATAATDSLSKNSVTISTIFDNSAPGDVIDFHMDKVNETDYKLYWKCPSDEDVERTYIYRSKDANFTADSGTRIQEIFCNKEESKNTVVVGDANTDYYFALRAIDRAGNAGGVVTNSPGTVIAGQVAGASTQSGAGKEGKVVLLPKEEESSVGSEEGQLGGGVSSEAGEVKGESVFKSSKLPLVLGGLGLLIVLAVLISNFRRKK